jgi:hypothetical protein
MAVSEETGPMGDADVLAWARGQRRVLLTENVQDFMPLHERFLSQGEVHEGIVFTSPQRFPRSTAGIGKLVAALATFLTDHPGEGRLRSAIRWL